MNENSEKFKSQVDEILKSDRRYKKEAYAYISSAVGKISAIIASKRKDDKSRHISGSELVIGLRRLLIEDFDRMAINVLKNWGITTTEDFGNIVFNLVSVDLLGVSDNDSIDDFKNQGNFHDMFVVPFKTPHETTSPLVQINTDRK